MFPWDPILERGHTALVLIRHGRTAWNAEGRFLGVTDIGLDASGWAQAERLSLWRGRFREVVSSPLARAVQTASVLEPHPRAIAALAELDQGHLEGVRVADAVAAHPAFFEAWGVDPGAVQVPGGGRLSDLRDGALAALTALASEHASGSALAVVSHQLVLASVLSSLDGAPLRSWREYSLPNVGVALLGWDGHRLRLENRSVSPSEPGG